MLPFCGVMLSYCPRVLGSAIRKGAPRHHTSRERRSTRTHNIPRPRFYGRLSPSVPRYRMRYIHGRGKQEAPVSERRIPSGGIVNSLNRPSLIGERCEGFPAEALRFRPVAEKVPQSSGHQIQITVVDGRVECGGVPSDGPTRRP